MALEELHLDMKNKTLVLNPYDPICLNDKLVAQTSFEYDEQVNLQLLYSKINNPQTMEDEYRKIQEYLRGRLQGDSKIWSVSSHLLEQRLETGWIGHEGLPNFNSRTDTSKDYLIDIEFEKDKIDFYIRT